MAEKNWLRTKSDLDRKHYLHLDKIYKKHLYHKKKAHIANILDKSKNKSGALYKILRSFAKPKDNNPLPDINKEKLPDEFANYFLNKLRKSWMSLREMINTYHLLDPALNYKISNLSQNNKH